MTKISRRAVALIFASSLMAAPALAQTAAPAPATTPAPAAKPAKPHSAASIECSKEADAKGLHGKERQKFRSQCKHDALKKS